VSICECKSVELILRVVFGDGITNGIDDFVKFVDVSNAEILIVNDSVSILDLTDYGSVRKGN